MRPIRSASGRGPDLQGWSSLHRFDSMASGSMIQFNGHFDGKVITPDEPVNLPVGTPLRVTIDPASNDPPHADLWRRLAALAEECAVDGPADLAERHDHYAHGKPSA